MSSEYKQKYLKYKKKYLGLKNLIGGFTYDLAKDSDKMLAAKAMIYSGIDQSDIDKLFYNMKKIEENNSGSDKVIAMKALLKNFNELELGNKHKKFVLVYYYDPNEAKSGNIVSRNDNLPDRLPDTETF